MKAILHKGLYFLVALTLFVSCQNDDDNFTPTGSEETAEVSLDLVLEWNSLWLELDRYATGMRPTATARSLAYIHLAAYETALPDMDGYVSNVSRLEGLNIGYSLTDETIDYNLALNSCYALVFDYFMYNSPESELAKISLLETAKSLEFESNLSEEIIDNSNAWGRYVAQQVISYSQTDVAGEQQLGSPQPFEYEPPVADGYWTYSADEERALFPYWGTVRTFVISSEETTSVAPMIYSDQDGSDFYNQMMEVYEINNAAREEQNEDLWMAEFWSDDVEGLMMSPPGRQISITNQLITQYDVDYKGALALYLKLGFALNDSAVSSWADKYEYMTMRPSNYIHDYIDSEYQTNLYRLIYWPNPSFPGYPSGHATFAAAAAGLFINQFGDATDFTDLSHEGRTEFLGEPRNFTSFTQMALENGYSRIPLGVHIRIDAEEGYRLGLEISDAVNNMDLLQ